VDLKYASLRVLDLDGSQEIATGADELLVLPLAGSCAVTCGGETLELAGRASVFDGATDFAYVPRFSVAVLTGTGRIALPGAVAGGDLPFRYGNADDVPVELRGAGSCSRYVRNFCMEATFDADSLLACEVITPGGNWSSYPPHKHDQDRPGEESVLEEIYYFEIGISQNGISQDGKSQVGKSQNGKSQVGNSQVGESGIGYMRAYSSDERPIDVLAEVRTGDRVLVPYGWHGPAMAVPGYDMYYLNVMAGPGERRWMICDDPAHAWIRGTWT
jgi:5-deoxy-glucuronate isomerase